MRDKEECLEEELESARTNVVRPVVEPLRVQNEETWRAELNYVKIL